MKKASILFSKWFIYKCSKLIETHQSLTPLLLSINHNMFARHIVLLSNILYIYRACCQAYCFTAYWLLINNLMLELLLDDWRILLKKFHKSTVQYIFNEANQCADALVKFGVILSSDYVNFLLTHQLWWRSF